MNSINDIYENLKDIFFTEDELVLVTKMCGLSMKTLDDACYARYGEDAESLVMDASDDEFL